MKRTQIYLLESQKKELDILAKQKGKALAEVVREAVDLYIVESKKNAEHHILQAFGMWKDRDDIPDSDKYVNDLRREMNSHLEDENK